MLKRGNDRRGERDHFVPQLSFGSRLDHDDRADVVLVQRVDGLQVAARWDGRIGVDEADGTDGVVGSDGVREAGVRDDPVTPVVIG